MEEEGDGEGRDLVKERSWVSCILFYMAENGRVKFFFAYYGVVGLYILVVAKG